MLQVFSGSLSALWSIQLTRLLRTCLGLLCMCDFVLAQRQLPYLDSAKNSPFSQLDFDEARREELILDAIQRERNDSQPEQFLTGTVSALDMMAPKNAVRKLREATSLLGIQKPKEAIRRLQKALEIYPKFVSAHLVLGLAYFDQNDNRAKEEFATAAQLDDQLPTSHLYLGMMSLWSRDFSAADASLEKAAHLSPNDPQILNALAFAQNGAHKYADVLHTVQQIHRLEHHGMGDVHYIAAAAALNLHDINSSRSQLNTFLTEEPTGPLSAVARQELDKLTHANEPQFRAADPHSIQVLAGPAQQKTFPNTPYLESELRNVAAESGTPDDSSDISSLAIVESNPGFAETRPAPAASNWSNNFTIRQAVDETALFLAVSEHGKMVNGLDASNLQILDDNRPPDRVLQFLPQSKLPLRLGILIDVSGSVEHKISFEKNAAKKFLDRVLNPESDLAFVAGFDKEIDVTQDFTGDSTILSDGVENISPHAEGTALFDAIHYACWKLAAYPDQDRVARVLVVLTDGEDNASHRSLQHSIAAAEAAGITIYSFNTSEDFDLHTDANAVLRALADRTGGESTYPRNMGEIERFFDRLSEAIRSRYLIAYKPADFVPDGSYRKLKVTAVKDGKVLQVHVRKGYYARLAPEQ